jgi:DNA-binding CsgD family transcriptional regulator
MMADALPQQDPSDPALAFWSIFEQSRIPMTILDQDRCYVKVNDALVDLWEYPRSELIGSCADGMVVDGEDMRASRWEQLVRTRQLYGERVIEHASGAQFRVTYAAHVITVDGQWRVLVVTLSARLPDGAEMIGNNHVESAGTNGARLTPREREVVRLVALGADTRGIAAELSLSPETVRTHVRNAMSKTGVHTRAHLVALVLSDGLVAG